MQWSIADMTSPPSGIHMHSTCWILPEHRQWKPWYPTLHLHWSFFLKLRQIVTIEKSWIRKYFVQLLFPHLNQMGCCVCSYIKNQTHILDHLHSWLTEHISYVEVESQMVCQIFTPLPEHPLAVFLKLLAIGSWARMIFDVPCYRCASFYYVNMSLNSCILAWNTVLKHRS